MIQCQTHAYITKVAFDHKFDRDEPDGHTLSMAGAKQK